MIRAIISSTKVLKTPPSRNGYFQEAIYDTECHEVVNFSIDAKKIVFQN